MLGFFLAFFSGVILGLLGGGGSILTLPVLVYFLGVEPTKATAYSLFIVGISALIATQRFFCCSYPIDGYSKFQHIHYNMQRHMYYC